MRKLVSLFIGLSVVGVASAASPFAQNVVSYSTGTGAADGYDNPAAALGEPSRITPGMFGGPVDPFSPAFLSSQLVSIGAGGSLTISFADSVLNSFANPFGLDFIIFGNNGFTITNGNFSGGGITDGSTFTFDPPGSSRVLVSADNTTYFELRPPDGLSTAVDGLFPTDGSGNFQMPVNPALSSVDFAGLDLAGIRSRYGLSGGGTGFDLAWARTLDGQIANLDEVRYIRVEVATGKVEIDGFAIVPEPSPLLIGAVGLVALLVVSRYQRHHRERKAPVSRRNWFVRKQRTARAGQTTPS